jgi:acyl carrier protein
VDALELAIEIERTFEVTIPDDEDNRKIFTSVDSLAAYITQHRAAAQA